VVPGRRRWRRVRQVSNGVVAAFVAAAILLLCGAGYAGLPALGPLLDPAHGAWASASGGQLPESQVLSLPGLTSTALVSFDANGIATINAASRPDAMAALGYLHARFRLTQMDLQRRLAEGRLAQLVGPAAVSSDEFELRLGLLRTARREWAAMPRTGAAATMLAAYARGVNDYLAQLHASGDWPALYSVAGVYPARWTPVDSLAVQGDLAQELDYTTSPLDYALLVRSLGIRRTMRWFPVVPGGTQRTYDPGPYKAQGIAPVTGVSTTAAPGRGSAGAAGGQPSGGQHPAGTGRQSPAAIALQSWAGTAGQLSAGVAGQASAAVARSAVTVLAVTSALPPGQVARDTAPGQVAGQTAAGSAWAANGPRVAGRGSILGGTAPLAGTVPSAWFQVAISAPRYDVTGISLPGLPGVVLGHNQHIAWSLSHAQDQSTLFYAERTSRARPGQYFWRGRWRAMRLVRYAIPVRGGQTRHLAVDLTVHGPVLTDAGQAISVDWTGSAGSPDIAALARIGAAASFTQFRAALAGWRSPAQTFVYADDRGNIGAIAAGDYPIVRHGAPWLPLPGTGADDVAGAIPFAALPQSYDPPGHVIATAGQRPVTAAYPYYIGTTASDLDPAGWASNQYAVLGRRSGLQPAGFAALQARSADQLAARLVPRLLAALHRATLTPAERQAAGVLRGWNHVLDAQSAAAAIWSTFWPDYLSATFGPWWKAAAVPVQPDPAGLAFSAGQFGLVQALEHWTLADPSNPAFTPPGGPARTAASVMRVAFGAAVARLHALLGGAPSSWTWGRLRGTTTASLPRVPVLGAGATAVGPTAVGPTAASTVTASTVAAGTVAAGPVTAGAGAGAPWTVAAGYTLPAGTANQGWRMIVWLPAASGRQGIEAEGIYPGGQSEDPASPWYDNLIARWASGGYLPMPPVGATALGRIRWELRP